MVKLDFLFQKYDLVYEQIDLKEFDADGFQIAGSTLVAAHDIVLLRVKAAIPLVTN
jgi:hypothetical protein